MYMCLPKHKIDVMAFPMHQNVFLLQTYVPFSRKFTTGEFVKQPGLPLPFVCVCVCVCVCAGVGCSAGEHAYDGHDP